jgi:hypothetical protein
VTGPIERIFRLRRSISSQLAEVDGTLEIWTTPGGGTRVTLWMHSA